MTIELFNHISYFFVHYYKSKIKTINLINKDKIKSDIIEELMT